MRSNDTSPLSLFRPSTKTAPDPVQTPDLVTASCAASAPLTSVTASMDVDTSQAATALLTEHLQYTPLVCSRSLHSCDQAS